MITENKTGLFKKFFALAVLLCITAVCSVSSFSSSADAAPQSAEEILRHFGVQGPVTCSTYGNNPNGFMAGVNNKIYVVDTKNNRIASIENPNVVFKDMDPGNSRKRDLFIAQFLIQNDSYDKDHHYGEWHGTYHLLPMYILVDYDASGNMYPAEKIFSGEGASPGHYHSDIRETKNNELAALLISEILPFIRKGGYIGEMTPDWPAHVPGAITTNEVDIHIGPGENYKSLGVFFKDDQVTLLNKITAADEETWYEVKYYNKQYGWIQGWVNGRYIKEGERQY